MSYVLKQFSENRAKLGTVQGLRWTVAEVLEARGMLKRKWVMLRPPNCDRDVRIRMHGESDWDVFQDTFFQKELAFAADLPKPGLVMDLGANVGYTAVFLLNLFPGAHLVAVEPDPANLEVCRANLASYGDQVQLIGGAIWHCRKSLVLSHGSFGNDGRGWATEVREAKPGETGDVEGWDILSLLEKSGQQRIGLLKIDIEGSEKELFSKNASAWLDRVDNVCVEIHGEECRQAVFDGLKDFDYQHSKAGGQWDVFTGIKPKSSRRA